MSDTILGGDFTVYYLSDNRQKRINWTGTATGTRTCNELYSALQDLFDDLNQMDDGVPMSAQTPTEYTIGIIDPGDTDPWFIDRTTVEHLKNGAVKTASWKRQEGANTGIVRMGYSPTIALVASDIGKDVLMTIDGDRGTLLDYNSTDNVMWIRPDSNAAANSFDNSPTPNGAWTIVTGTGTGTQSGGVAVTGESLWSGIFSIGTIAPNTHLYVVQNGEVLTAYKDTTDWWDDGQIDILVNVQEVDVEVDEGFITVLARRYTATYDNFETDLTSGGRNPIPLATGKDLDNQNGYRQITASGSSGLGTFLVDDLLAVTADVTKEAIVTAVEGTAAQPILQYYLIGDPLTDFTSGDFLVGFNSGATATFDSPINARAATLDTVVTVDHGANETFDINEDGSTENYSIVIDCKSVQLSNVYEWTKYLTRRGNTAATSTDALEAQQYIGSDYKIVYTTLNGTINEGQVVTQDASLAKGTVVAHNTTDKILILRNSRRTFNSTNQINNLTDGSSKVTGPTATVITPTKAAPFGTFAGGTWFCAPGVVLHNVPSADVNNYQLTDDDGDVVVAPTKVTATISNTRKFDSVSMFRLAGAGGDIKKTEFFTKIHGVTAQTIDVGSSITSDTPPSGSLRLVDTSANKEYRMRFNSYSGSVFALASTVGATSADTGTTGDTLVDHEANFITSTRVGDLVFNKTLSLVGYVTTIDSVTKITHTLIPGQTIGHSYDLNTLPVTTQTADNVYVPIIDIFETTGTAGSPGTESATVTFIANIPVRSRVRQGGVILPFETDGTITNAGLTISAIRTADSIAT